MCKVTKSRCNKWKLWLLVLLLSMTAGHLNQFCVSKITITSYVYNRKGLQADERWSLQKTFLTSKQLDHCILET